MRVTIVLDTGGFFPTERKDQTYLDVGYFQTPGPSDIEVYEDGSLLQASSARKLGGGNQIIEVEHLEKDGVTVRRPVNLLASFKRDILRKDDLYPVADIPSFIAKAYDCIFRFNSGDFSSADVRERKFTEHVLSDDGPTGNDKSIRAIANEIHIDYDLGDGEILRLHRAGGQDLWSSSSVGNGSKSVKIKLSSHDSLKPAYYKRALGHKIQLYYLPNSDPPPMNGP